MTPPPPYDRSVLVDAPPARVWDLVADVTRTGQWSVQCREAHWDDPDTGPQAGAWFTGRNEVPGRTWQTRSLVEVADRPREFTYAVGGDLVRWSWLLAAEGAGTRVVHRWEFLPAGVALFEGRYGEQAAAQVADRERAAHEGIPVTLAAVQRLLRAG